LPSFGRKPYTDCRGSRKHLNGKSRFGGGLKSEVFIRIGSKTVLKST